MEAFESIVASILENDGYWVRRNFKVDLSKGEKIKIGRQQCSMMVIPCAPGELTSIENPKKAVPKK